MVQRTAVLQLKAESMTEGLEGVEELNDNDLGFQVRLRDASYCGSVETDSGVCMDLSQMILVYTRHVFRSQD